MSFFEARCLQYWYDLVMYGEYCFAAMNSGVVFEGEILGEGVGVVVLDGVGLSQSLTRGRCRWVEHVNCGRHFRFAAEWDCRSGLVGSGGPGLTQALVVWWGSWAGRLETWYGGADQCGVFRRIVECFEAR